MRWFSLILTFGGAISAVVAWFALTKSSKVVIRFAIPIFSVCTKPLVTNITNLPISI